MLFMDSMAPSDWEQVRSIYLEGIRTCNATFETQAPSWQKWDESHLRLARTVARDGDRVLGWGALSKVSDRRCYSGVAEASIYVGEMHRGKRIGEALLRAVISISELNGIWTLQAGVFPENRASLALLRKCGFREVGRRERLGQLDGAWRDVLLLERRSMTIGV